MTRPRDYQVGLISNVSTIIAESITPKESPTQIGPPLSGYNTQLKASDLDLASTPYCKNARIRQNFIEPRSGISLISSSFDSTIMEIKEFELSSGTKYYMVITTKSIYVSSDLITFTRLPWTYVTGTVTIHTGDKNKVHGVDTVWLTNARIGDRFKVNADGTYVTILSIESNTELTLSANYPTVASGGSAYTIDRYFGGTIGDRFWSQVIYDADQFVFSQGIDPVLYVGSGVSSVVRLNVSCPAAKYGIVFADRLVIGCITDLPFRIQWSARGNYDDWTAVGSGYKDCTEEVNEVTGLSILVGSMVIYKKTSIMLATQTGVAFSPLSFATAVAGIGCYIPGSLCSIGLWDTFWAKDNYYKYDGRSDPVSIGDQVKDNFLTSINPQYLDRCHSLVDSEFDEVQFYYPEGSSTICNKCLVYNYNLEIFEGIWDGLSAHSSGYASQILGVTWNSLIGKGFTWNTYPGRWNSSSILGYKPISLLGIGSSLYKQDPTYLDDAGTSFICEWYTKIFKASPYKMTSIFRVVMDYFSSITTSISVSLSFDGGKTWSFELTKVLSITDPDVVKMVIFDFLSTYDTIQIRFKSTGGRFKMTKSIMEAISSGDISG